jgi:GT2 family glycosyltransferase
MSRRIEFGIVNYNGGEALARCVRSVLAQRDVEPAVTVFDNASSDDSIAILEASGMDVAIERSAENLGYAGACNRLWRSFRGEAVVLCNMDLEFDPEFSAHVLETFARHPKAWVVAPLCVETGETLRVNSRGVSFFWDLQPQNIDSGKVWNPAEDGEEREIFGCYGAAMALRRSALEALGGLDEDYFLFYEETDLAWRAALMDWISVLQPKAVVRHERSMTTVRYSPFKLFHSERNRVRTAVKLLPLWYLPLLPLLTATRLAFQARASGVPSRDGKGGKISKATILWTLARAWLGVIATLPRDLDKRRQFWKGCPHRPLRMLHLLRRHSLGLSELTIR